MCRRWNAECNRLDVIKSEKFLFSGASYSTLADFTSRIHNCRAVRPTVEFFGVPLDGVPEYVWRKIGTFIEALLIYDCNVRTGFTISNIILHCNKLKKLHLFPDSRMGVEFQLWDHFLDEGVRRGIRRESLTSFKLYSTLTYEPDSIFGKFFKIYPKIATFRRTFSNESLDRLIELPENAKMVEYRNIRSDRLYATSSWLAPYCKGNQK